MAGRRRYQRPLAPAPPRSFHEQQQLAIALQRQKTCFYDLPAELRIEIYKLVLLNVDIWIVDMKRQESKPEDEETTDSQDGQRELEELERQNRQRLAVVNIIQNNIPNNLHSNVQRSVQSNVQSNVQNNLQSNMQNHTQHNPQHNFQNNLQNNLQINTQINLPNNLQSNLQPTVQNLIQNSIQSNPQTNPAHNAQPNIQMTIPSQLLNVAHLHRTLPPPNGNTTFPFPNLSNLIPPPSHPRPAPSPTINHRTCPNPHPLLLTTRQIRHEVLPLLHSLCSITAPITNLDFTPLNHFMRRIPPHERRHLLKNPHLTVEILLPAQTEDELKKDVLMRKWLHERGDVHVLQPRWRYVGETPNSRICNDLRRRFKRMNEEGKKGEFGRIMDAVGVVRERE